MKSSMFSNTKQLFRKMSVIELASRYALVKLSSFSGFVSKVRSLTNAAIANQRTSHQSAFGIFPSQSYISLMKSTIFKLYVAGERIEDCLETHDKISAFNMRMIIDHSTEEKTSSCAWEDNVKAKTKLLDRIPSLFHHRSSSSPSTGTTNGEQKESLLIPLFVPIKITSLFSPELLEILSATIIKVEEEDLPHHQSESYFKKKMTKEEKDTYEQGMMNLERVCLAAKKNGLSILLDAEQSHRQPAIDFISRILMARLCGGGGEKDETARLLSHRPPLIYNTYQMYLKGSYERLRLDIEKGKENNYPVGIKLVRGAYMVNESERALEKSCENPIMPSKQDTDEQYNEALSMILGSISENKCDVSVLIATHNRESIIKATELMKKNGLLPNDPRIHFAQIMGLCDNLGHCLGDQGYNAHKLVLFGDFSEVFPWLLRRLDENQDVMGATIAEAGLLKKELWRRFTASSIP
mmetsp:Transcript_6869/g.10868  ORF Transcript_6869/g.10868 Transcript_6869/m.10868 type:complete len:467 (+) Transcript_6869:162-1562(+)